MAPAQLTGSTMLIKSLVDQGVDTIFVGNRGHFVQVEPRMSISGAAADDWVPARPGTEGILALGLAHHIVATGRYQGKNRRTWSNVLKPYMPSAVAEQTDIPEATITRLAETFSRMMLDLEQSRNRLVAAERVAAWQEFARRMAHELKNPLTPIILPPNSSAIEMPWEAIFVIHRFSCIGRSMKVAIYCLRVHRALCWT